MSPCFGTSGVFARRVLSSFITGLTGSLRHLYIQYIVRTLRVRKVTSEADSSSNRHLLSFLSACTRHRGLRAFCSRCPGLIHYVDRAADRRVNFAVRVREGLDSTSTGVNLGSSYHVDGVAVKTKSARHKKHAITQVRARANSIVCCGPRTSGTRGLFRRIISYLGRSDGLLSLSLPGVY